MRLLYVLLMSVAFLAAGCGVFDEETSLARQKEVQGDTLFASGEFHEAVERWESSLEHKQNPAVYEKVVSAYIFKQDFSGAHEASLRGLTYFPDNANLLFNLALVNYYSEDFAEALKILESILEISIFYPHVHYLRGLIYERKGDLDMARAALLKEINLNPTSRQAWKKIKELNDEKQ